MIHKESIRISSEDIRQQIYCRRINYFRKIIGFKPRMTAKMHIGRKKHYQKTNRERKKEIKNDKNNNYYDLVIEDKEWGLITQIDAIEIVKREECEEHIKEPYIEYKEKEWGIVKEYKTGEGSFTNNQHQKGQVVFQAIVIERCLPITIIAGKIINIDKKEEQCFPITPEDKVWVLEKTKEIQIMLMSEEIPQPTVHEGKCINCEYYVVCKRC